MFGYRIPNPDEAMIVSGAKSRNGDGTPFRIVTGHGKFVNPLRSKVSFLSLSMQEAEVQEPCVTQQGITLMVKAVIAFKVGDDTASIVNAARRFLADEDQMPRLTGRIFAGSPSLHSGIDDRRGPDPGAAEAGRGNSRCVQTRDGHPRPSGRFSPDREHRRPGFRIHQGSVPTPRRGGQSGSSDRAGTS